MLGIGASLVLFVLVWFGIDGSGEWGSGNQKPKDAFVDTSTTMRVEPASDESAAR